MSVTGVTVICGELFFFFFSCRKRKYFNKAVENTKKKKKKLNKPFQMVTTNRRRRGNKNCIICCFLHFYRPKKKTIVFCGRTTNDGILSITNRKRTSTRNRHLEGFVFFVCRRVLCTFRSKSRTVIVKPLQIDFTIR